MENTKYLTEESYAKTKKKIIRISLIIFVLGLLIGGGIIVTGVRKQINTNKQNETNSQLYTENKTKLSNDLAEERKNVEASKKTLKEKVDQVEAQISELNRVKFTGFDDAYYAREAQIEELKKSIEEDKENIGIIEQSLKLTWFNEVAKNNSYTSKHCDLKEQLDNLKYSENNFAFANSFPFYIIGAFIIIASVMISIPIYLTAKGREIAAFATQQGMPVAKETIDEITPTVANAAGTIAKEISKGINSNKE